MENMKNLISIKAEINNNISELRKKVYQSYPAVGINDIEITINKINSVENEINKSFTKAIMNDSMKYPRRNRKTYDMDRIIGLVVPF